MDATLLGIYLNDHLAAATAGVELVNRVVPQHDGDRGTELSRLAEELAQDREALRELMKRLDIPEDPVKTTAGWLGEKVGRLKPNAHLLSRSPLSDVLELEMLRAGTAARIAGLQVLRAVMVHDQRVTAEELEHLLDRAQDHAERLYKLHLQVAQENLTG